MKEKKIEKNTEILSRQAKIIRWIFTIVLFLYTCFTIFVLVTTLLSSFKTKSDLVTNFAGLPKSFTIEHYITVLTEENLLHYFDESLQLKLEYTLTTLPFLHTYL